MGYYKPKVSTEGPPQFFTMLLKPVQNAQLMFYRLLRGCSYVKLPTVSIFCLDFFYNGAMDFWKMVRIESCNECKLLSK